MTFEQTTLRSRAGREPEGPSRSKHRKAPEAARSDGANGQLKLSLAGLAAVCAVALVISIAFAPWSRSTNEGAAATSGTATEQSPIALSAATATPSPAGPSAPPSAAGGASEPSDSASASEPSASEPEPATGPYETGAVLVALADGASADDLLAGIADESPLAGLSVAKEGEGYVKLELPAGLAVEEALDRLGTSELVEGAQPNYRYRPLDTTGGSGANTGATGAAAGVTGAINTGVTGANIGATGAINTSAATTSVTSAAANIGSAFSANTVAPASTFGLNDTYYDRQWALASVNAPAAWDLVAAHVGTSSPVTVAVIDNGFRVKHEDLAAHVVDYYNVYAGSTTMGTDHVAHGTHVAGIVSAVANNGKGIAGMAGNTCGLMLLRVSDSKGDITTDTIVDAYAYLVKRAKTHNVRVVNMSLGTESKKPVGRSTDPAFYDAIAKARKAGIVTVAAACNSEAYSPPFHAMPADFDNVISVINLEQQDNADGTAREWSSNYNVAGQKAKNIAAPGTGIASLGGKVATYRTESGTSMASPLVAGVLGLMFTVNPKLTADQAAAALYASARDLAASAGTAPGWDDATGYGEVDAAAAVQAAGAAAGAGAGAIGRTNIGRCNATAKSVTYKRKALKPAVKVTLDGATLRKGIDYTVKYRDNKSAGKAAFAIMGKGAYCGIAVGTFTIKKAKLKKAALKATAATANGGSHKPAVKWVKIGAGKVSKANYKVTYWRGGHKTSNFKAPGTIKVKITGKANCKGTITKKFRIA